MIFIEVLVLIAFMLFLSPLIHNVFSRRTFGHVLIKIKQNQFNLYLMLWGLIVVLALFTDISLLMRDIARGFRNYESNIEIAETYLSRIIFLFPCIYFTCMNALPRCIKEKGICSEQGSFVWDDVQLYEWDKDNTLILYAKRHKPFHIDVKINWRIQAQQKEEVHQILLENVKKVNIGNLI